MSISELISKQNSDGGWPYVRGGSWTEPTVYAVMALLSAGETEPAERGIRWIRTARRPDGGWPPRRGIDESTWVTGLVSLLSPAELGAEMHDHAIRWLLGTQGKETTLTYRLREWLLGNPQPPDMRYAGWPWLPGTAAWVGPTSIAVLALMKEESRNSSGTLRERIEEGQSFLLSRICKGGGWNHGSSNALGYAAHPYPETTGMALAALRGRQHPKIGQGIQVALQFLSVCRSTDALNWLRVGLGAHDRLPAGFCPPADLAQHTIPETSLSVLVDSAQRQGRGLFVNLV
ncbi:MAG: terpene cyclase/mutase family protein [Candidatus Sulfopaludibacter sp.]|nr:terpene cyclase/mutase family protein [Candidatus Sulfopaludibacter sp.]